MTESEIWELVHNWCNEQGVETPDFNRRALMERILALDRQSVHTKAINEIENQMERWHHGRDNDAETLQEINDILVRIGRLEWFNKL